MRLKRIYKCLRQLLKFLRYKTQNKQVLVVDGKLLKVARLERALTQRIKRGLGGLGWGRRKRKLYSIHKEQEIQIDEKVFGVLVMAIVNDEAKVIDIWFTSARKHEVKALRQRLYHSGYLRKLFREGRVLGDKAYRGLKWVEVCERKEQKSIRQRVEGIFARLKFLECNSGWRTLNTLLIYLTAVAVASYYSL